MHSHQTATSANCARNVFQTRHLFTYRKYQLRHFNTEFLGQRTKYRNRLRIQVYSGTYDCASGSVVSDVSKTVLHTL
jgi:hypothetical protein